MSYEYQRARSVAKRDASPRNPSSRCFDSKDRTLFDCVPQASASLQRVVWRERRVDQLKYPRSFFCATKKRTSECISLPSGFCWMQCDLNGVNMRRKVEITNVFVRGKLPGLMGLATVFWGQRCRERKIKASKSGPFSILVRELKR